MTIRLSLRTVLRRASLGLVGLALASDSATAAQFGTAITYQGRLASGTEAASGLYDLQFKVFDSLEGTIGQVGPTVTSEAVPVTNGLFTLALDFGRDVFTGPPRWLDIAVRTNGAEAFTPLTPRQQVNPAPYALYAPNAGLAALATKAASMAANAITASNIAGGTVVKSLNALRDHLTLAAGTNLTLTTNGHTLTFASPSDWHRGGNLGTTAEVDFLGTTDNQALELRVGAQRALRLEPTANTPNVIAGYRGNTVGSGSTGVTIAGGGGGSGGEPGGPHLVGGRFVTIGGGSAHRVEGKAAYATIAGGLKNVIQDASYWCTIGGGRDNSIIGTGRGITASGGTDNAIGRADYATVGGGANNTVEELAQRAVIAGGYLNTVAAGASNAVVSGGFSNKIGAPGSVLAGGHQNQIGAYAECSVISGGTRNSISERAAYATIPGGRQNAVSASYGFAAGRQAKVAHSGVFVWADDRGVDFTSTGSNQFLIRAGGGVGINKNNPATALDVEGVVTATGFSSLDGVWTGSDARWKQNVQPITGALAKITRLQGVTYDWRHDEFPERNFADDPQLGFLAQEVETIIPEAVRTDADGNKAVAYEKLTAVLAEGLKEQQVEIKGQQAEIEALKARNAALEEKVAELTALVGQLPRTCTVHWP